MRECEERRKEVRRKEGKGAEAKGAMGNQGQEGRRESDRGNKGGVRDGFKGIRFQG